MRLWVGSSLGTTNGCHDARSLEEALVINILPYIEVYCTRLTAYKRQYDVGPAWGKDSCENKSYEINKDCLSHFRR